MVNWIDEIVMRNFFSRKELVTKFISKEDVASKYVLKDKVILMQVETEINSNDMLVEILKSEEGNMIIVNQIFGKLNLCLSC